MIEWDEYLKDVSPLITRKKAIKFNKIQCNIQHEYWVPTLDLHNLTLEQAYSAVINHIDIGKRNKLKYVCVITGKSGEIKREFPAWLNNVGYKRFELLSGGGAFKVFL